MAVEDFGNYLKHIKFNMDSLLTSPESIKEEIDAWVSLWLVKWKERVKILFGNEDVYNRNLSTVTEVIRREIFNGVIEKEEFKDGLIYTLINYGEIVGTNLLANTIINRVSNRIKYRPEGIEGKLKFLNDCIQEAKNMSMQSGKIIFISVKDYNWRLES
jgi:hypothetical protein